MKFSNGNWLLKEGVQANYAHSVYEAEEIDGELKLLVPTHAIRHRGDTLGGANLSIELSSPLANILKARICHFSGDSEKSFKFNTKIDKTLTAKIEVTSTSASITSGDLKAEVKLTGDYQLQFMARDEILATTASRGSGYIVTENDGNFIHEALSLGVGENIFGLGERFTSFVKNGQVVETWNEDGGSGSDQAYKSIPFYLTNRGYGVFVNNPGKVSYEIGSEKVDRVQFSVPGEEIEYFFIYGPTPAEILERYTALTGRPVLPPAWSFGLWLSTSFTTDYSEATVTEFIEGMAKRDLPLHVFHFDCFWMREFRWTNFKWDARTFPDPESMLKRLKDRGLRISLWINSYIAQNSELFPEAHSNKYLILNPDGTTWQWDLWQPGMGIVDFTNPKACSWFKGHLDRLIDMGVDCFKTDFGERIPTDVKYFNGANPVQMHNYYPYIYNKTVFEALQEKRGPDAIVFARSATVGCQGFPVHWGGDCFSNFESMAASLRAGLSLSLCGFGFWSHDIGGFEGNPPPAVYKRWLAFGLLSSHSRLHGSGSYRVPWNVDEESVDVLRLFTKLKCKLMPYLFGAAIEAKEKGLPMMRPMMLEFPNDPACALLDRQYMLGGSILVAPIFTESGVVDYYLPQGTWTHLLTGETREGGWHRETYGYLSLPLFVREGTILPIGKEDSKPDYDFSDGVTFEVYPMKDGESSSISIPDISGASVGSCKLSRAGKTLTIEVKDISNWKVLLIGNDRDAISEFETSKTDRGILVLPTAGTNSITLS